MRFPKPPLMTTLARITLSLLAFAASEMLTLAQELTLPLKPNSVRFAVIGDMGTGTKPQYQTAAKMNEMRDKFPFDFVIMLGDNIYGGHTPRDFENKFEQPYKPLLSAGVKFYATLGNHDKPNDRFYKPFNMNGQSYYTYKKNNVRFFAMDTTYMSPQQLAWLEKELQNASSDWIICYFHHALYSSAAFHGSATELRAILEPLFVKYRVNAVFSGHDHVYERVKPQKGIQYFTEGASGALRMGNLKRSEVTAFGYDQDCSFMLVEIAGDELHFQTITRTGRTIDSGVIQRLAPAVTAAPAATGSGQSP